MAPITNAYELFLRFLQFCDVVALESALCHLFR